MEQKIAKKKKILFLTGAIFLLTLVIGGAFAYFQIVVNNNTTSTSISGRGSLIGQASLTTNVDELKLDYSAQMMSYDNIGKIYYATETGDRVEEPSMGNGIYNLATASLTESDVALDCTYSYDITATVSKDVSVEDANGIRVVITESNTDETEYMLSELLDGVTHTGNIKKLTHGADQNIQIKAYIVNTRYSQITLSGLTYTIIITPKSGEEGFSCDIYKPTFVEKLINSGDLWSSGLEGDGLRYVGSGTYDSDTTPSNFICFGTTSASECKANENKYMYRIIGIFPDENGTQHLKLRKLKQLGTKAWHSTNEEKNWGESTLYTELNGSYFLENTTYSYLQDDIWSNKIENWKWTAVNTLTYSNSGPDYYGGSTMTPANIYLHEMNRSTKTSTVGEWTYPEGKIGLIYASDYVLSLGDETLAITGSTYSNRAKLKTGWLHYTNNLASSSSAYDWTIARYGGDGSYFYAWDVSGSGSVYTDFVTYASGVAPVFYLTSDISIGLGSGTYTNPYIISN